eukprot:366463-Chlamydomonas_euryale.AAC.5
MDVHADLTGRRWGGTAKRRMYILCKDLKQKALCVGVHSDLPGLHTNSTMDAVFTVIFQGRPGLISKLWPKP